MDGLDFLILAVVVAGAFVVFLQMECEWREWCDELERQSAERRERWRRSFEENIPVDWLEDLEEIQRIPETAA